MYERKMNSWVTRLGCALMVAGGLIIALPGVHAVYGNWWMQRLQAQALEQWRPPRLESHERAVAAPPAPWPWKLEIPKISLRWLVYEGADVRSLRRHGAGHIAWTNLPWQKGTVGIAGHRTTYGAPFFHLQRLGPGDVVRLTTAEGTFIYEVAGSQEVLPEDGHILAAEAETARLALVACSPPYSAKFRLVVFAPLKEFWPHRMIPTERR